MKINLRWLPVSVADWMHDNFKSRRSFNSIDGWTFKFGPIKVRVQARQNLITPATSAAHILKGDQHGYY